MRYLSRVSVGVFVILFLVLSSACQSAPSTTPQKATGESTGTKPAAEKAANPAGEKSAPTKAVPSGKIVVAISDDPQTADPIEIAGPAGFFLTINMYDSLYGLDKDGKLVPALATSYQLSNDNKRIEFTLRQGVKFQNGDPFTAKDVKFSFERLMKDSSKYYRKSLLTNVDRVEIIDDYKVAFVMKQSDVDLLLNLDVALPVMPAAYTERVGDDGFAKNPVGTGPFKLVKRVVKEYSDLESFDGYWDTAPSVKNVTLRVVPDPQARVAMLETGEAQIATNIPIPDVKRLSSTPGIKVISNPIYDATRFTLNTVDKNSPLADVRVRKAMNYAIDRDAIVSGIFFGQAKPLIGPVSASSIGADPNLKPYTYDPAKAKQLLAEAGYAKGFDVDLSYAIGRHPMNKEVTEAVASYLNAVGIRAKPAPADYSVYISGLTKGPKASQMAYVGGSGGPADPGRSMVVWFGQDGNFNVYDDPEIYKGLQELRTIFDPAEREKRLTKMITKLYDDAAQLYIHETLATFGVRDDKVDWRPLDGQQYTILQNAKLK